MISSIILASGELIDYRLMRLNQKDGAENEAIQGALGTMSCTGKRRAGH
jgi:hypothetical protein